MSGVTKHPSINLAGKNLADVSNWLSENKLDGQKIYGKKDENGNTILYLKSGTGLLDNLRSAKGVSFLDRLPDGNIFSAVGTRGEQKRDLARNELARLYQLYDTGRNLSEEGKQGLTELLTEIGGKRGAGVFERDAAAAASRMRSFIDLHDTILTKKEEPRYEAPPSSTLHDLGAVVREAGEQGGGLEQLPTSVSERIIGDYERAGPADRSTFLLALADSKAFKADLERELLAWTDGPKTLSGKQAITPAKAEAMAESIYKAVSAKAPCGRFEGASVKLNYLTPTEVKKSIDLQPLTMQKEVSSKDPSGRIKTEEFVPQKVVASGSDGLVVLYANKADQSKIIVKVPIFRSDDNWDEKEEKIIDSAAELKLHAEATRFKPDNIIGFQGGARMPDTNAYALVIDHAANGTVYEAVAKLNAMVPKEISREQADVLVKTLIKDMATGLQQLHEVAGATHYDFKSPNCLIGADGRARVMDFGRSSPGQSAPVGQSRSISNATWKAPEVLYGESTALNEQIKHRDAKAQTALAGFIGGFGFNEAGSRELSDKVFAKVGSGKLDRDTLRDAAEFETSTKADVWALGVIAFELFTGEFPFETSGVKPMMEVEQHVLKFAGVEGRGTGAAAVGGDAGTFLTHKRDNAQDGFMNFILNPDPAERPSAAGVLEHASMKADGVGSEAAYNLIALVTGQGASAEDIKKAREDLVEAMRPKNAA